jgi:formyl-CoA transferase
MHTGLAGEDEQLRAAGLFIEASHTRHGPVQIESTRYRLSRTPAIAARAAPMIGEHTSWVLENLLGYEGARVETLRAAGALG